MTILPVPAVEVDTPGGRGRAVVYYGGSVVVALLNGPLHLYSDSQVTPVDEPVKSPEKTSPSENSQSENLISAPAFVRGDLVRFKGASEVLRVTYCQGQVLRYVIEATGVPGSASTHLFESALNFIPTIKVGDHVRVKGRSDRPYPVREILGDGRVGFDGPAGERYVLESHKLERVGPVEAAVVGMKRCPGHILSEYSSRCRVCGVTREAIAAAGEPYSSPDVFRSGPTLVSAPPDPVLPVKNSKPMPQWFVDIYSQLMLSGGSVRMTAGEYERVVSADELRSSFE
jgi:hypothetical protein